MIPLVPDFCFFYLRDGGSVAASPQNESSPVAPKVSSPAGSSGQGPDHVVEGVPVAASTKEVDPFDEFDPRSTPGNPYPECPLYVCQTHFTCYFHVL